MNAQCINSRNKILSIYFHQFGDLNLNVLLLLVRGKIKQNKTKSRKHEIIFHKSQTILSKKIG